LKTPASHALRRAGAHFFATDDGRCLRRAARASYVTITAEALREPCILLPSAPAGLIAFGADSMVVATRGARPG